MPRRRYDEEWMYSRSRTPSAIRRARQLVITSLATLGTALLCGLANHGPAVSDAVPPVGWIVINRIKARKSSLINHSRELLTHLSDKRPPDNELCKRSDV